LQRAGTAAEQRFFVITGGPGSGKSTLIEALVRQGYGRTVEAGRAIIQDQVAIGGPALPWSDPGLFAELMLSWELRSYATARDVHGPVLFDRGIPDVIGYLTLTGLPVHAHVRRAAELFRYHPRVFIAPPWRAIFTQDRERRQTPDEAERTHDAMVRTYGACGYELVPLPLASVEERARFVMQVLQTQDGESTPC
jgi:predicted ATPase